MANIYRLDWQARVRSQIRQIPNQIGFECLQAILSLSKDPYPPNAEELPAPYKNIWKIKLDGWRILYEVIEEDMALCEFVCSSKIQVQEILRSGLDLIRKELSQ